MLKPARNLKSAKMILPSECKNKIFIGFFRATRVNRRAQNRTNTMTADEVITRLKDRMSQHKVQIRQAFLSFDKTGKGRVNKKNFREVRFPDLWVGCLVCGVGYGRPSCPLTRQAKEGLTRRTSER